MEMRSVLRWIKSHSEKVFLAFMWVIIITIGPYVIILVLFSFLDFNWGKATSDVRTLRNNILICEKVFYEKNQKWSENFMELEGCRDGQWKRGQSHDYDVNVKIEGDVISFLLIDKKKNRPYYFNSVDWEVKRVLNIDGQYKVYNNKYSYHTVRIYHGIKQ
jgi:hypothetical protein